MRIRHVVAMILAACMTAAVMGQQTTVVEDVQVGTLCRVKSTAGPCTFVVAHPAVWDIWQPLDDECAVATDRAGDVVLIGSYLPKEGEKRPRIDRWVIRITKNGPSPPAPPNPVPPSPPSPPAPRPTDWQGQVTEWTKALPADAQGIAPQVAQAFADVAARCGQDLYTGPEIRAALDAAVRPLDGYVTRWNGWSADVTTATAKWATAAYRDAAAYRERLNQVAAGIRAAVPSPPPPVSATTMVEGVRLSLDPRRHQIRGGRLFEYRCPTNGKRCSWIEIGTVLEKGAGWVIVQ